MTQTVSIVSPPLPPVNPPLSHPAPQGGFFPALANPLVFLPSSPSLPSHQQGGFFLTPANNVASSPFSLPAPQGGFSPSLANPLVLLPPSPLPSLPLPQQGGFFPTPASGSQPITSQASSSGSANNGKIFFPSLSFIIFLKHVHWHTTVGLPSRLLNECSVNGVCIPYFILFFVYLFIVRISFHDSNQAIQVRHGDITKEPTFAMVWKSETKTSISHSNN